MVLVKPLGPAVVTQMQVTLLSPFPEFLSLLRKERLSRAQEERDVRGATLPSCSASGCGRHGSGFLGDSLPGRSQDGWKFTSLPWKGIGTLKKPEDSWLLLGPQMSTPPEPQEERQPFSYIGSHTALGTMCVGVSEGSGEVPPLRVNLTRTLQRKWIDGTLRGEVHGAKTT